MVKDMAFALNKWYVLIFAIIVIGLIVAAFTMNGTAVAVLTPTTPVAVSTRGMYTSPPVLKGVTPFVPTGFKLVVNGDTLNNDLSYIDGVTLTQAAAQTPAAAVGFTFVAKDGKLLNANSTGSVYYKKAIDFVPSTTVSTYRRVEGKDAFEMIANFDTIGNDIGNGPGTASDAMTACRSTSLCDGFTLNSTGFGLKSNVVPYSYYNWSSFTYAKSTYTLPAHTWTPVV
jgi:hypothetical protein